MTKMTVSTQTVSEQEHLVVDWWLRHLCLWFLLLITLRKNNILCTESKYGKTKWLDLCIQKYKGQIKFTCKCHDILKMSFEIISQSQIFSKKRKTRTLIQVKSSFIVNFFMCRTSKVIEIMFARLPCVDKTEKKQDRTNVYTKPRKKKR